MNLSKSNIDSSPGYGERWTCSVPGTYSVFFSQENNGEPGKWAGILTSSDPSKAVDIVQKEQRKTQNVGNAYGPFTAPMAVGDYIEVRQGIPSAGAACASAVIQKA